MFKREIAESLTRLGASFPAVMLTGPRQSGKTFLLRQLFPKHKYLNLEDPSLRFNVESDPKRYFSDPSISWIIDEAQRYPELFSYLQVMIDEHPKQGRFILSGSQNFLLSEKTSQSLAGRVAILELLPLTYNEYVSDPTMPTLDLNNLLYQGLYPRPHHEHLDLDVWYRSYIQTYLERDVRSIINLHDLSRFQLFLKLCAGRHGQLLSMNALAVELGVTQPTVHAWLSILEQSFIVYRLQPYYRNFNKRLVKTPKLYFYDTAIVCQLLDISDASQLTWHPMRGALFEGYVITEVMKAFYNRGKQPPVYFSRDYAGREVDLLIEQGEKLSAVEIKSSMTPKADAFTGIQKWIKEMAPSNLSQSFLIHGGTEQFNYQNIEALPWHLVGKIGTLI